MVLQSENARKDGGEGCLPSARQPSKGRDIPLHKAYEHVGNLVIFEIATSAFDFSAEQIDYLFIVERRFVVPYNELLNARFLIGFILAPHIRINCRDDLLEHLALEYFLRNGEPVGHLFYGFADLTLDQDLIFFEHADFVFQLMLLTG